MKPEIVLCADMESVKDPKIIGLDGENLLAQPWLRLFCSALEARRYLVSNDRAKEVWIASSDEVDPINLAAAVKKDSHEREVFLLVEEGSGSLKSRAHAAELDGVLPKVDFLRRYAERKETYLASARNMPSDKEAAPNREAEQESKPTAEPAACVAQGKTDISDAMFAEYSPSFSKNPTKKTPFVLPIISASGGSGKSTVAVIASFISQKLGYETLLIDADLQFGDTHFMMGKKESLTLDDIVSDPTRFANLRSQGDEPALLAAPMHLEQFEELIPLLPHIIEKASDRFDVIIINSGAFWTEHHIALLEHATRALFLVDQRPSSLRACKHALDLCSRCGIATTPFLFAVNRCTKHSLFTSLDVSCALGGMKSIEISDGGGEVEELLGFGMPRELMQSKNAMNESIEAVLVDLFSQAGMSTDRQPVSIKVEKKKFHFSRKKRRAACL